MSEPIPLRDGHSRRRQEGRGEEEKRFGSLEKTSGGRRTVAGACQAEAATEKAGSQLRVLCFRIQFVVIRTGPSFVRYVCSFFLCTSLPPPPRFYLLFRDTRCQAYRSVVATLSCARDNQLPHATPRLGPREFRGKEMNELASSLTREGGREVGAFEGRSDCGDWEEGGKGLVRILRCICCYWK